MAATIKRFDPNAWRRERERAGVSRGELYQACIKAGVDVGYNTLFRWEKPEANPLINHLAAVQRVLRRIAQK